MMKFSKWIGILIIVFSLNACQEKGLLGEISQTQEQLEDVLEEIQEYKSVDFANEKQQTQQLIQQLKPYIPKLKKDHLFICLGLLNADKANKKFDLKWEDLEKDIIYSENQLSALHFELKHNTLSNEKAQEYFSIEKQVLEKLVLRFKTKESNIFYLKDRYQELIPKSKLIVDSLLSIQK